MICPPVLVQRASCDSDPSGQSVDANVQVREAPDEEDDDEEEPYKRNEENEADDEDDEDGYSV
jgi:hypothetical protein